MMNFELREVNESDKGDLLKWRNDPLTRKTSFQSDPISPQEHAVWFNKIIKSNDHFVYIGDDRNKGKIGVVRFDKIQDDIFEINITIKPEQRGQGLGTLLIKRGCEKVINENKAKEIIARIKPINKASIKSFNKADFIKLKEDNEIIEMKFEDKNG